MENIFFDYTIFIAFMEKLCLENKKEINLIQLHNYRLQITKNINRFFDKYDGFSDIKFEKIVNDYLEFNNNIDMPSERKCYDNFITKYKAIFTYKDGNIYLNSNITYEAFCSFILGYVEETFDELEINFSAVLNTVAISIKALNTIDIVSVKYELERLIDIEESIQRAYSIDNSFTVISAYNSYMRRKINELSKLSDYNLNKYSRLLLALRFDIDEENYLIMSDKITNDKFYINNVDMCNFSDKFIKAIFNSRNLPIICLQSCIDDLWGLRYPDERFSDYAELVDDTEDDIIYEENTVLENNIMQKKEDTIFYTNYIDLINKYMLGDNRASEMQAVKSNLLYVFNSYGHDSVLNDSITNLCSKVNTNSISFDEKYIWSKLFLIDILEENFTDDKYVLRKLLFISNYYNLTKNLRIKKIINKYKKTEIGNQVYNAIFNNDYSYFVKKEDIKSKIKKKY